MGGQSIDRREALRYIGIASVAATFPGFSRWTFACSPDDHLQSIASTPASAKPYQPLFLSPGPSHISRCFYHLNTSAWSSTSPK